MRKYVYVSRRWQLLCFENNIRAQQFKSMSYDELLTTASMTSLYCRRLHQALILLFKCLNGTGPTYIGSLFKYRHTPYRLRGEGLNLELPNFNLTFKKNSFTYSLTKLWNSQTSQVRLSRYANDFKSKLHKCSVLERVLQCTIIAFQNVSYSFRVSILVYGFFF